MPAATFAQNWDVIVVPERLHSISNDDGWGSDDIYWVVYDDSNAANKPCSLEHRDNGQTVTEPDGWTCRFEVAGSDPNLRLRIRLMEYDSGLNFGDDWLDIHPRAGVKDVILDYGPKTSEVTVPLLSGWEQPTCAGGTISARGTETDGEFGEIAFRISSSHSDFPAATPGDSDGDGFLDSWEVCGIPGVDLPGMGADRYRQDVFVELDWMVQDNAGANNHSHEPWLPALVNAWHEFDVAPVLGPTRPDGTRTNGIALHLDTGELYRNYVFNSKF